MSKKNNTNLPSLRSRYLLLASATIILLLIGAIIASWYINKVSSNNAEALTTSKAISTTISSLRDTLSHMNITINTMLIRPEDSHTTTINEKLIEAFTLLSELENSTHIVNAGLASYVAELHNAIYLLDEKVRYLIKQRQQADWVYPMLPYINNKMLEPNRQFLTSVGQAINEYASEGLQLNEAYSQLHQLRYLWQNQIMDFRAVIVRFAGLNTTGLTPQEQRIGFLHNEIEALLKQLKVKQQQGRLELQTDVSLGIMIQASEDWYRYWKEVQEIRQSTFWRGDIAYLNKYITPLQNNASDIIRNLEAAAQSWSGQQTSKLSDAARSITTELWILVLLAISFVIMVYIMIEKLVLKPTTRIAHSLIEDAQETIQLEDSSSQEIFQLTSAFNNMRKQIHQRQVALEYQALHDSLTRLPNRALLNDRLSQAIHIMQRNNDQLSVLLLDLDRFKEVNDTLGHHVGDQLLQMVAKRLESIIRHSDTVARLGGDEFAVIAPNTSADDATLLARKIINALNDVFTIDHQNLYVGTSIGISVFPENGDDVNTLLRHADSAMYVAKGNNLGVTLYQPDYDKNSMDNLSLVGDLHHAIRHNEDLTVYYHPQMNLLSREINQVEALLRWQHPIRGFIAPDEIIALAEQTGMIRELSLWVMETAIREYMQHLHKRGIGLSINLSAWNLQDPELLSSINSVLDKYKMPAEKLTLEITETAMMSDPIQARKILNDLNAMGIELAIDDYGTGFSSLSYLKLLPVQELKIDKSFIFDMLHDENDAIIVHSTIELAHNLGYKVVAEGVENNETQLQLRKLKCDYVQGYYLAKPQDIYQLIIWLNNYKPQIAQ